jgi:PilZ domain
MPRLPSGTVSFKLTPSSPECATLQAARCAMASDRDVPQEPELALMSPEKRHGSPRLKLDKLVYVNLHTGNGGILLDVSGGGLGLQAAAPLGEAGPLRFRLSIGAIDQIEAAGELLWIDGTGKRGGLRFTDLPEQVRHQLGIWLGQPRSASSFVTDSASTPTAGVESSRHGKRDLVTPGNHPSDESFLSVAKNAPVARPAGAFFPSPRPVSDTLRFSPGPTELRAILTAPADDLLTIFPPKAGPAARTAPARPQDTVPSRHGFSAIAFFLALGVAIGILSFIYKGPAGESLIRLGERISGESHRQPVVPEPALGSSSSAEPVPSGNAPAKTPENHIPPAQAPPDARAEGASESDPSTPASHQEESKSPSVAGHEAATGPQPASRDSGRGYSPSAKSSDRGSEVPAAGNGQAELAFARRYLAGARGRGDTARAAQLLWLAIEKGSTAAEVDLAELYARGEGVPKNCEQARILLTAAFHENNARAGQELSELRQYGCR